MIGKRLRALREDSDRWAGNPPHMIELAEHLGVTPSAVSRWEKGSRPIPGDKLVRWLDWLKATPGERAAVTASEQTEAA